MKKWKIILFLMVIMIPIVYSQGFGHCAFGNYPFGHCAITEEPTGEGGGEGGGGGASTFGFPSKIITRLYDLIVEVQKNVYIFGEVVNATIIIENKGDIPDKDTVLIYWLSNSINEKFGQTKEQFLEVPVGKTKLMKNIAIPETGLIGEWRFNVNYSTSFQDTIEVYDSFRVKEDLTFIDKFINNKDKDILGWVVVGLIVFIIIHTIVRKEYLQKQDSFNVKPPENG